MYKASIYLLLPLMLINLTVAENRWLVLGFRPDVLIYAITIGLAWYVGLRSPYRVLATMMLMLAAFMRVLGMLVEYEPLHMVEVASLGMVFAVAGALIYGRNPSLLHKCLVIYLALCIPIMILQMLGVSSLVMGWNIGYLHDPSLMVIEEVGTFKEVPLHPTLFVGADELSLDYGQARPVGLMYASNALSIFVAIAVAVNVAIERTSRIGFSDFVVTVVIGLTMSKLVFAVTIVLYLGVLVFGSKQRKILVLKLTVGLAVIMYLYYVLFPGLFMNNLSIGMIMIAVMLRLMDLMTAAGIEIYFDELADLAYVYRPSHVYEIEEGYSFVATLLRGSVSIPWLFLLTIGSILYMYRIGRMSPRPVMVYMVTLTACIMTQFAIPFVKAASFQLILGFALFPLFPRISSAKG